MDRASESRDVGGDGAWGSSAQVGEGARGRKWSRNVAGRDFALRTQPVDGEGGLGSTSWGRIGTHGPTSSCDLFLRSLSCMPKHMLDKCACFALVHGFTLCHV